MNESEELKIEERKHISLPWHQEICSLTKKLHLCAGDLALYKQQGVSSPPVVLTFADWVNQQANADFVELACNNHYELVGLLEEVESNLAVLGHKQGYELLLRVRSALGRAQSRKVTEPDESPGP